MGWDMSNFLSFDGCTFSKLNIFSKETPCFVIFIVTHIFTLFAVNAIDSSLIDTQNMCKEDWQFQHDTQFFSLESVKYFRTGIVILPLSFVFLQLYTLFSLMFCFFSYSGQSYIVNDLFPPLMTFTQLRTSNVCNTSTALSD